MFIVIALLVPVMLYLLAGAMLERRVRWAGSDAKRERFAARSRRAAFWGALFVLIYTATKVVLVVAQSTTWRQGAEVVWTGVRSAQPRNGVRIGGTLETATTQWPEGYAWPVVEIRPASGIQASISTWGGRGFVQVGGQYVNGVLLPEKGVVDVGGFTVEHVTYFLSYHHVRVRSGNRAVVDRWLWLRTDSPFTVGGLAGETVGAMLASKDKAEIALAVRLESWAAQTQFVRQTNGVLRVLDAETTPSPTRASHVTVALPFDMDVRWPNRRLPTRVSLTPDERVQVRFLPPWRSGTPMPPGKNFEGGPAQLVVTAQPRPGDYAFQPPIGFSAEDPRAAVAVEALVTRAGQLRTTADNYMVPGTRRVRFESGDLPEPDLRVPLRVPGRPEDSIALDVHVVLNLLRWPMLAVILLVGIVGWMAGNSLAAPSLWRRDAWTVSGFGLVAWSLLNLRLLLAVRYALDPRYLDSLGVTGVATASGALVILPGFLFVTVRLWRDTFEMPDARAQFFRFWKLNAYLMAIPVMVVAQAVIVRHLWSDLPTRLTPPLFSPQFLMTVVFSLVGAIHNFHVNFVGVARARRLGLPLHLAYSLTYGSAQRFWARMSTCAARFFWKDAAVLAGAMLASALLFGFVGGLSAVKAVQEIAAPLVLVWFAVLFFIGYRIAFPSGTRREEIPWKRALMLAVVLAALPVFAVPVLLHDVGGVLAALAVFVPLVLVLVVSRARRPALAAGGVLLFVLGLTVWALSISVRLGPELQVGLLERGLSRYVVFRQGANAQRYLPSAEVPTGDPERVTARSLRGAIEHTWENAAMIHEGGVWGRGFDGAPNRRSMVPQTALQYDSTFSFFIAAEHGAVGGVALAILYMCPLGIVLWSSRRMFDSGHALAAVIAASFFGEAIVHVAANLGAMPFTGRNLPLLSVLSMSDLFRWTILFALMGQAMLWRTSRLDEQCSAKAASFLEPLGALKSEPSPAILRLRLTLGVATLACLLLLQVVPTARNLASKELQSPFGWDEYLKRVSGLISEGKVGWNDGRKEAFVAGTGWLLDGSSLLEQEVTRFNALPDDEKYGESTRLAAAVGGVASLPAYDAALGVLRVAWSDRTTRRRPPLFRLAAVENQDVSGAPSAPAWMLEVNPDYNVRLSFASTDRAEAVPAIRLSDTRQAREKASPPGRLAAPVVGPAWVNGRVGPAVDGQAPVAWLDVLARVMEHEWRRLSPAEATKRYGTLTLERPLQESAMAFMAARGRALHKETLQTLGARSAPRLAVPPRVALSIIELPTGKVLAMGGWPRMALGSRWQRDPRTHEWLPPAAWLEREAPTALKLRYQGDRNFDAIEMGSATKPIWAAAVLGVHPQIHRQLRVRGVTTEERDVYGIPLQGKPWQVHASGGWVEFSRYLTESDNRYQVRLGFAGLAEAEGTRVAHAGPSISAAESMAGSVPVAWKRYPRFPALIGFSEDTPNRIENLHLTPLAERMRTMFGASVKTGDRRAFHSSFWSGLEADEWPAPGTGLLGPEPPEFKDLRSLSPQATLLGLDLFGVPRPGQPTLSPRNFVDLLLGGGENRWANIEFAAAFSAAVTGRPLVAHITRVEAKAAIGTARVEFPAVAATLRPGLAGVVGGPRGTATGRFTSEGALAFVKSLPGVRAYAKTGTLVVDQVTGRETSRMVLVLVRWKDEKKGLVQSGLVLSMVAERATQGTATTWMAKFLMENREWVRQRLKWDVE